MGGALAAVVDGFDSTGGGGPAGVFAEEGAGVVDNSETSAGLLWSAVAGGGACEVVG